MRPRLLDLFCGAGGAAMGYHRAGFEVVGVDHVAQPHYPFEFWQCDALKVLSGEFDKDIPRRLAPERFDAIHASPPCQGYSRMRHLPWLAGKTYPLLIDPVRELMKTTGLRWVIENVEDAPMPYSVVLCGQDFGLPIYRHRRFGSNIMLMSHPHQRHEHVIAPGRMFGDRQRVSTVHGFVADPTYHGSGRNGSEVKLAMGIDWMTREELAQAIPPAYTEWIGAQLLEALVAARKAKASDRVAPR